MQIRNADFMYNWQFISWNFRNLLVDNLVNILALFIYCNGIISYKIMIYFMFLTTYTRPHKLVALIFIVFK